MTGARPGYLLWRRFVSLATGAVVYSGGITVIVVVAFIFLLLFLVVAPLLQPAKVAPVSDYALPGGSDAATVHYRIDGYREVCTRITLDGRVVFFRCRDGSIVEDVLLPGLAELPEWERAVRSFAAGSRETGVFALGLNGGKALIGRVEYDIAYRQNRRIVTPRLSFPLGRSAVPVDERALVALAVQAEEERVALLTATEDGRLLLASWEMEESLSLGEPEWQRTWLELPRPVNSVTHLQLDPTLENAYAAERGGYIAYYRLPQGADASAQVERVHAIAGKGRIADVELLSGGRSLLIGDSAGRLTQWMPVRDRANRYSLTPIRRFDAGDTAITDVAPEYYRRGFMTVAEDGRVGVYYATSHRTLWQGRIGEAPLDRIATSPRADVLLIEDRTGRVHLLDLHNPHPEFSWPAVWARVWYEDRSGPSHTWQSSSASSDFEPKFSIAPLTFGTFKAAFYAMLFSLPIAVLGAIYTAYFMAPALRATIKPAIEIMEALPTVILGFLAGLWLAPLMEAYLAGTCLLLVLLGPAMLATAWVWRRVAPASWRKRIPEGWEALLLVPVVLVVGVASFGLSRPLENLLFDGSLPLWLSTELGIRYDQRNSLVVGVAMGFAVIPTIFSISEDAVYSVPSRLVTGSLALGATHWQTMVRIVLLTASPGIFSAIMIGMGRAIGETMIVIMATGNTAIMDLNLFQGFRAMSANIATEMPESEVGSTHYRILFLTALVLFCITFVLNTLAEVVRQRLRVRYSNL